MKINKTQLNKLIKEVMAEMEVMSEETPKYQSSGEKGGNNDSMKHSTNFEKEYGSLGDTVINLGVKGIKKGNAHVIKDFLAQVAYDAKLMDLEIIHAEMEKGGKEILSLSSDQLEREPHSEKQDKYADVNLNNLSPEEQAKWSNPNLDPVERRTLYRLSKIKQGERASEWEEMGRIDAEKTKLKQRQKAAAIAAGTFSPYDDTLWTDREWDLYNQGVDPKDFETALKTYKSPSHRQSDIAGKKLPRVNVGTLKN